MATFFIHALGCKVNTYEIESVKESLLRKGLTLTFDYTAADYILINTCCVTNTAQGKSRQKISHYRHENKNAILIVMGCYVQGFEEEIKKLYDVNLLVGTKDRSKIVEYIDKLEHDKQISLVEDAQNNLFYENLHVSSYSENTRAFLKIQDGCNNFCSYCIIPYVRGRIKSRKKEEVIEEAKTFIKQGYKEIVLIGIHTGSYGKDLNDYTFSDLVEELLKLEGLYRLRVSSIEESEIDDKFIYLMKHSSILAQHLHIPLQAGSDHILKLMNRKYDADTFLTKVKYIKEQVPNVAISTDIIVGFPQESQDDFEQTLKLSQQIGFAKIHVFPYSSRNNTIAAKMSGQIHGSIKKLRAKQLIALSDQLASTFNQKYLNQEVEVLIEEIKEGYAIGHTTNFIKVKCKIDTTKVHKNDIIKVRIINCNSEYVEAIREDEINETK